MSDLKSIVDIFRAIESAEPVDGTKEGYLEIQDETLRAFLSATEQGSRAEEVGLSVLVEPDEVRVGARVRIQLFPPRDLPVYRNLAAYLGSGARLLEPVGQFYIVEEDWFSEDENPPSTAANLVALHRVLEQLCEAATVVDREKTRLLFADSAGVVDLPINISPEDLHAVTGKRADEFVAFCSDDLHRQHRLEAVAKVVAQETRGISTANRLHHVVCNLEPILVGAKSQHAVFLSAFSYEKVRDEVEALKVEYTAKVHKVLSDIQGQLLGIPAATVVVATQMKETSEVGAVFMTNVAVLLGAFIFGTFLILLLRNQRHTLEIIETEVARQKRQLKAELRNVARGFDATFEIVENRIKHQRRILWAVDCAVAVGLVLSCLAFWMLNSSVVAFLSERWIG